MSDLHDIANEMVSKGILAADESWQTMNKRLESVGVERSEDNRYLWRKILADTDGLEEHISGVILSDDMVHSPVHNPSIVDLFANKGILTGIKVDKGAKVLANFPREKVTEGLDGLRERLVEYRRHGMKFAKWRAVLDVIPSVACVQANAHALARYAALCQEAGLVPIVEPEVLMDGGHHIEVSQSATEAALHATFDALHWQGVDLKGIVLKPNMVMWGYDYPRPETVKLLFEEVAEYTLETLRKCVPASVPGIAFLSGGQPDNNAVEHLGLMNLNDQPWRITFSYGRALQGPALREWSGKEDKVDDAQKVLLERASKCYRASFGILD